MEAIADLQNELICQYDPDLRLTYVNRAYSEWADLPKKQLIGTEFIHRIPTEELPKLQAHIKSLTAANPSTVSTHPSVMPDGTHCTIEWTDRALFDEAGHLTGYLGIGRDVTIREQQAQQIIALQTQLASVLDTMQDAVISLSLPDLNLIYASASIEKVFGYPLESVLNSPDFYKQIVHPDDLEEATRTQQTCLREGYAELDHRIIWPDGQVRWVNHRAWASHDENGHPTKVIDTTREITTRKQAELSLQQSNQTLELFVEYVPAAVAMFDQDMKYLAASRRWFSDFHITDQNVIGRSHYEIFPDLPERFREAHRRCLAGATEKQEADIFLQPDGTLDWLRWEARPWHDSEGQIGGIIIFIELITAQKEAEEALRRSEDRYRQMFEVNGLPKLIIDPDNGQLVDANPAAITFYGYDLTTIKKMNISAINQSPPAEIKAKMADAAAHKLTAFHFKHRLATDTIRDVEVFSGPIEYEGKSLLYSTITDVTEREKAKIDLQEVNNLLEQRVAKRTTELETAKNRLEALFNHSGDAILLLDLNQTIQQANHSFEELTTAPPDSYPGKELHTFLQPENTAQLSAAIKQVTTSHQKQVIEARTLTDRDVEISLAPINRSSQPVTNLVCIIRDITERKKAEEALRESEELFRTLFESIPDMVLVTDTTGHFVNANTTALRLLEYTREEFLTLITHDFVTMRQDQTLSQRKAFLEQGYWDGEVELITKDGRLIPGEVRNTLINLPGSKGRLEVLVIRDITERKKAEENLKLALEKEKETSELKSRFVSIASHEFRTPLASILATTETLTLYRNRMDETQIDTRLGKIRQQVLHLKEIMDDVLHQARLQAGRVEYHPMLGNLDTFCRDIIEEFETQPDSHGRLVYKCPTNPATATYDEHLMRQILSNLISNALKYSPLEKPVNITLTKNDTNLVLQVSDQGIGIPPEDLGHLFEPFHRAVNVGNIPGTGLGLNIAKQSVEMHGGTITADSEPDQGTTFTITLPLV